jgi:hypothetical protein
MMTDLRTQIRDYARQVDSDQEPLTVEEIVGRPQRLTRPRPPVAVPRGLAVAVTAAVGVLALIGGVALLVNLFVGEEPPVVTTPEPRPTEVGDWPLGLTAVGGTGMLVVPFESPDQPTLLESDEGFARLNWAIPDQRGGLIFQHEVTPEPWPPGAVLWLRAGAITPELLIPPAAPWRPGRARGSGPWPLAGVLPIGVATSAQQHALFIYSIGDWSERIMAADLDEGGEIREVGAVDGGISPVHGPFHATVAGGVIALFDLDNEDAEGRERCVTVTLIGVDDGAPVLATGDCLPFTPARMNLSHDAQVVGIVGLNGTTARAAVIDLSTGAILEEGTIDVRGWRYVDVVSSPGGLLVYVETDTEFRLLQMNGDEWLRMEKASVPVAWPDGLWIFQRSFFNHPFDLGREANDDEGTRGNP